MGSIKKPRSKKGARFAAQEVRVDYNKSNFQFSFQRIIGDDYCFSELSQEDQCNLINSIFKRRDLPWNEIEQGGRHQLGAEKIPCDQIKKMKPRFIKDDTKKYLVLRFSPDRKAMVGYRIKDVFYVLWLDKDFTLYKH